MDCTIYARMLQWKKKGEKKIHTCSGYLKHDDRDYYYVMHGWTMLDKTVTPKQKKICQILDWYKSRKIYESVLFILFCFLFSLVILFSFYPNISVIINKKGITGILFVGCPFFPLWLLYIIFVHWWKIPSLKKKKYQDAFNGVN